MVTVQLPLFNERFVVRRLLDAVEKLDYPRDRLEIQVLDDSTDDTTAIAGRAVADLRERGVDAVLLHRTDRVGFKAGALANGLKQARGEIVAVFDADFVPPAHFLLNTVPWLVRGADGRAEYGMVQARWGHLNLAESWLTHAQGTLLDGHFVVEHGARKAAGVWFNFNGTAGLWRREVIADAGGWEHDTLTEDLDLSYRAQLAGWRFQYLHDTVAPAELPSTMAAFKAQQHRWAKGAIQVMKKLLPRILASKAPFRIKAEATAHLAGNLAYPLVIALAVLIPPAVFVRASLTSVPALVVDATLFGVATIPVFTFYGVAVIGSGVGPTWRRLLGLPVAAALGVGISISQSRAVLQGLFGSVGVFVRTPKRGGSTGGYRARLHGVLVLEIAMATYLCAAWLVAAWQGHLGALPFLGLFAGGFTAVAGASVVELVRQAADFTLLESTVLRRFVPRPR